MFKQKIAVLHVKDVAEQLGIHYLTAARLVAQGEFPNAWNVGGEGKGRRYRIPQPDVDRYREINRVEPWW